MLDYFRSLAVKHGKYGCTSLDNCDYNPTLRRANNAQVELSDHFHEFVGPDARRYTWVYVQDRHTWVFVDRDRHTASYKIVNDYNVEVIRGEDDGISPGRAYSLQLPVKYFLDSFTYFN